MRGQYGLGGPRPPRRNQTTARSPGLCDVQQPQGMLSHSSTVLTAHIYPSWAMTEVTSSSVKARMVWAWTLPSEASISTGCHTIVVGDLGHHDDVVLAEGVQMFPHLAATVLDQRASGVPRSQHASRRKHQQKT